MPKVFFVNVSRCVGCYNCQLACKDEHVGNDWAPYARPQPPIGQFWMKVDEHVCGTIPKVKMHYIPHNCAHCGDPACAAACPAGAFVRREDGLLLLEPEKCTGCRKCLEACPYGAIYFNEELNIAQKCTGCAHLLDHGESVPRCVEACPTDALLFGEYDELKDKLKDARPLESRAGCRPRLYYQGIPGRFVAATVYDPGEKEVVIGARVTLTDGKRAWTAVTDDFGDFWLRDVPERDDLALTVEAAGFRPLAFRVDTRKADVNLGDLPMLRTT